MKMIKKWILKGKEGDPQGEEREHLKRDEDGLEDRQLSNSYES